MTLVEQNHSKLSLQHPGQPSPRVAGAIDVVCHAIEQQLGLRATYNRGEIIVAPHILYERGGALFLDAVVLERDGERPAGDMLATFKLSTLRSPIAIMEPIVMSRDFDAAHARYSERIVASLSA